MCTLMKTDYYVKFFANCILVKGYNRSLLCDLQNETSHLVPNQLVEIADRFCNTSVKEIKSKYDAESCTMIDGYINYLIDNNFAFYCSAEELELFPKLSMEWDYPAHLTNAIIDINSLSNFDFREIFLQLDKLGCKDIQIRAYDIFSLQELRTFIAAADNLVIKNIQLYAHHDPKICNEDWIAFLKEFPRLGGLVIHSADINQQLVPPQVPRRMVAKIKEKISSHKHCGVVDQMYFTTTLELFTESQSFNSCLNRKIGIDVEGNIKNCPSVIENFGNIRDTSLEKVIQQPDFKKLWGLNKDQIEVCKDCEFRHICTDCRAFREVPSDILSKPLKCGYDPYSGEWSDWSNNPLKEKAISFYGMK